jgi:hypothetical protein
MNIDWTKHAKLLLRRELAGRGVTYPQLAEALARIGIKETPENIANKVSRGKFTAVFLLQCLEVIGCERLTLKDS